MENSSQQILLIDSNESNSSDDNDIRLNQMKFNNRGIKSKTLITKKKNLPIANANFHEPEFIDVNPPTMIQLEIEEEIEDPTWQQNDILVDNINDCVYEQEEFLEDDNLDGDHQAECEPKFKRFKIADLIQTQKDNCNLKCGQCNLTNQMILNFECSFCVNKFPAFGLLQQHIYQKHRNYDLIFEYEKQEDGINCCEIFMNSDEKYLHKQMYLFNCSLCQDYFLEFQEFFSHLRKKHLVDVDIIPPPALFSCEQCSENYETEMDLKIHVRLHAKLNYQCEKCDKKFIKISFLADHNRKCKGKTVVIPTLINQNYQIDTEPIERPNTNNNLIAMDNNIAKFKDELMTTNELIPAQELKPTDELMPTDEEQNFQNDNEIKRFCRFCNELIKTTCFVDHLRFHKENPYKCRLCKNQYFPKTYHLSRHFAVEHANYKHYRCKYCELSFRLHTEWRAHQNLKHQIDEEYESMNVLNDDNKNIIIELNENELMEIQSQFIDKNVIIIDQIDIDNENINFSEQDIEQNNIIQQDLIEMEIANMKSTTKLNKIQNNKSKNVQKKKAVKTEDTKKFIKNNDDEKLIKLPYKTNKRVEIITNNPIQSINDIEFNQLEKNCDECKRGFSSINDMIEHQKNHKLTKLIKCTVCSTLINRNAYIKHFKSHGNKPYKCSDCSQSFHTLSERDSHLRQHQINDDNIIYEEICIEDDNDNAELFS